MRRYGAALSVPAVLLATGLCCPVSSAQEQKPDPPQNQGFSAWNVQLLYGTDFQEPFNPEDVSKGIVTFENAAGWSWGSSFFFVDVVQSDGSDDNATEVYSEWYPSASLSKVSGNDLSAGVLRDVAATLGINAGTKSTGAAPLIFLPGVTFDLKLPGFAFFSLGTYAYIDQGRLNGDSNGCHSTTYQVTPSWGLPFSIGGLAFSLDGFVDFIGDHGDCAAQILAQTQLKVDAGQPGGFLFGIEWQYWDDKFGIEGLDENFPQALVQWKF
jgi:nucleoside-specific outer membrane channel protein Tsx